MMRTVRSQNDELRGELVGVLQVGRCVERSGGAPRGSDSIEEQVARLPRDKRDRDCPGPGRVGVTGPDLRSKSQHRSRVGWGSRGSTCDPSRNIHPPSLPREGCKSSSSRSFQAGSRWPRGERATCPSIESLLPGAAPDRSTHLSRRTSSSARTSAGPATWTPPGGRGSSRGPARSRPGPALSPRRRRVSRSLPVFRRGCRVGW